MSGVELATTRDWLGLAPTFHGPWEKTPPRTPSSVALCFARDGNNAEQSVAAQSSLKRCAVTSSLGSHERRPASARNGVQDIFTVHYRTASGFCRLPRGLLIASLCSHQRAGASSKTTPSLSSVRICVRDVIGTEEVLGYQACCRRSCQFAERIRRPSPVQLTMVLWRGK